MTAFKLAMQLGEYLSMEIDDINRVEYSKASTEPTEFTVVMENGNRFSVRIEKV